MKTIATIKAYATLCNAARKGKRIETDKDGNYVIIVNS